MRSISLRPNGCVLIGGGAWTSSWTTDGEDAASSKSPGKYCEHYFKKSLIIPITSHYLTICIFVNYCIRVLLFLLYIRFTAKIIIMIIIHLFYAALNPCSKRFTIRMYDIASLK